MTEYGRLVREADHDGGRRNTMNPREAGAAWQKMRERLRDGDVPSPDEVAHLLDCTRFRPPHDLRALAADMLRGDVKQRRGRKRDSVGRMMWQTAFAVRAHSLSVQEREKARAAGDPDGDKIGEDTYKRWMYPREQSDHNYRLRKKLHEQYKENPDYFVALMRALYPTEASTPLP
jgi:hypothetical protein